MWQKKGLIFKVEQFRNEFIKTHGSIPFALHLSNDEFLIFFSSRNQFGKSLPFFIKAEIKQGNIYLNNKVSDPILPLGALGSFDDSGIMPCCAIWNDNKIYLYYIGWNPQVTVSYRLSIGLAISEDNGKSFKKFSEGPILDRDVEEPFFNTAPFVMRIGQVWKMWYISCTKWSVINNYTEPSYHIKSATSIDGIHWIRDNIVCVDYDELSEAIGRPCVIKKDCGYEMYFSYRKITDYRITRSNGYQIGMAISSDTLLWEKKYEDTGIELSTDDWDSIMMEYCHVFTHKEIDYMLYNGNDFGKEGFGYAIRN